MTRWLGEVFPPNMMRGFRESTERYGALLDYMEMAVVDGFIYLCPRPVGAPKTAKGPPPPFIFKLLARLHPAIRKRNKRAVETFKTKRWREDVERWDRELKPAILKANAALAAIDPFTLELEPLIAHLAAAHARVADAIYCHHALNACSMLTTGDFLAHAKAWTGLASRELVMLLSGHSPVSTGAQSELDRLVEALRGDRSGSELVMSNEPPAALVERLRSHAGAVGAAMQDYLGMVGIRLVSGYDVGNRYALEVPEVIIGAIRAALHAQPREIVAEASARATARVRDAVPEPHRDQFDELLAEARYTYRIRDERCYLNDAVASGIARRALLAAGQRLVTDGKLHAPDHAVDLTHAEVVALLRGQPGPTADETAAYVTYRTTKSIEDAPARIGYPPSPPPSPELLPPVPARAMRAISIVLFEMFDVPTKQPAPATVVRGVAASAGSYEGRARVVLGTDQFSRIEKGDVLIARHTSPSYNVLLPLLGGIVTDRGGLLSHAAIVAREYGMPAVVGTTDGTAAVPDGARVRIDGSTGEVVVLS
ncbi:MAG: PEP-utilizing enzyme [Kofleriaceae bacterium]